MALLESGHLEWHPQLVGAMAWSVLVLTLGGSSLLYLLIQRGAATRVTSLMYLVPPCTAVLAWALFGETLVCRCWPASPSPPSAWAWSWCERDRHLISSKENAMSKHRIAVIAGDGIGKEVMPEGLRALDAAARRSASRSRSTSSTSPAATSASRSTGR